MRLITLTRDFDPTEFRSDQLMDRQRKVRTEK